MTTPTPRPRAAALDAVRVLGIVAVVAGHILTVYPGVRPALYSWHVPVFFMLSGYLWTVGRTLADEAGRRLRTLGLPYLSWLVLIGAAWVVHQVVVADADALGTAGTVLAGAGLGRPFSAFWFVAALFFATLLWRAVERLLPRPGAWAVAAGGLAAAYIWGPALSGLPLEVGLALPATVFLLAGQELRRVRGRIRRPDLVGGIALAAGAAAVASGLSAPLDMKASDYGTPVLSVLVAILLGGGLTLLAESWVPRLRETGQRWIVDLAGAGLVVVLVHAAVLWAVVELTDLPRPATFGVVLVVSWLLGLLVVRTPWAPWLAGRPQARPSRPGSTPPGRAVSAG